MRLLAPLALAMLLLATLLPGQASAAPARATLTFAEAPLLAPGALVTLDGNLTYAYDEPSSNATLIDLAVVEAPAWLTASIEPAHLELDASGGGRAEAPVRLLLRAAAGTAAATQGVVRVAANASANPPLEAFNGTREVPLRVAFAGDIVIAPVESLVRARPGEPAQVQVRVRNAANGPAEVTLTDTGVTKDVLIPAGSRVIVEAGEERLLNVSVLAQAPGSYPLQLRFTTAFALDERAQGPSSDVSVTLEVRAGAPLPAVLALAALA
ncbi:MAG TPA: hypothetical protein VGR28_07315, partial [Candidatus Thermoplasmatota archaeon]|nr:hypothetical protein [Candidatus Thermoplasmatota archaeon]